MDTFDTALISLGEGPAVWGQFPALDRWNGWLTPRVDALAVVQMLDWINSTASAEFYGYEYDWTPDGSLVLLSRQDMDELGELAQPEILTPDADGLYPLGAYAWVWGRA